MLAIKECLRREGVLNLDSNSHSHNSHLSHHHQHPHPLPLPLPHPHQLPHPRAHQQHQLCGSKSSGQIYASPANFLPLKLATPNGNNTNMDAVSSLYRNKNKQEESIGDARAAASDLKRATSANSTAKFSCQQQPQQTSEDPSTSSSSQRQRQRQSQSQDQQRLFYRGQHPHFYNHAAPAYYTDLNLRIHTPNASDVGALNENYQSVYSTPTQLLGGSERYFPRSSSATVIPQPIGSGRPGAAHKTPLVKSPTAVGFFRGDSAPNEGPRGVRNIERYAKSSPASVSPTKGDEAGPLERSASASQLAEAIRKPLALTSSPPSPSSSCIIASASEVANASLVFGCANLKPSSNESSEFIVPSSAAAAAPITTGRLSRHKQRFGGGAASSSSGATAGKRAVRVRSESRPISALYDIICKEKGLELDDTSSTNSSQEEHEQLKRKSREKSTIKPATADDKLATFWPLQHGGWNTANTAGGGASPSNQMARKMRHTPRKNPTADGANAAAADDANASTDDDDAAEKLSVHALHSSHKNINLPGSNKAASLPPMSESTYLKSDLAAVLAQAQPVQAASTRTAPAASTDVLSYDAGECFSTSKLFVEPPKLQLVDLRRCLASDGSNLRRSAEPAAASSCDASYQGEVRDTLARWQEELSPVNGANDEPTANDGTSSGSSCAYHSHHPPTHSQGHELQQLQQQQQQQQLHQLHEQSPASQSIASPTHHQATNARRFITRSSRSASRQSANGAAGHSPPPPAHLLNQAYSEDDSSSSAHPSPAASPTRLKATAARDSSANGNSSAYETAATTVMTHTTPRPQQTSSANSKAAVAAVAVTSSSSSSSATTSAHNTEEKEKEKEKEQQQQPPSVAIAKVVAVAVAVATNTEVPKVPSVASVATAASPVLIRAIASSQEEDNRDVAVTAVAINDANKCSINCNNNNHNYNNHNNNNNNNNNSSNSSNNSRQSQSQSYSHSYNKKAASSVSSNNNATPMPPLIVASNAVANNAPLIAKAAAATAPSAAPPASAAAASPVKRRKNPLSPLRIGSSSHQQSHLNTANAVVSSSSSSASPPQQSPLLGACNSAPSSPAVRTTKASRLRAAALDKKKEEERQRLSSPCSPTVRRLSGSELSTPKSPPARSASQPAESQAELHMQISQGQRRLVPMATGITMKQNLSELQQQLSSPVQDPSAECSVRMRPRSSTLYTEAEKPAAAEATHAETHAKYSGDLTTVQLSPVQHHQRRTPDVSPRRGASERDKSAKRKSNLNRSLNEEATQDGEEALASRRRRRRELGMARQLVPGEDAELREMLQATAPQRSSCSESTNSLSNSTSKSKSDQSRSPRTTNSKTNPATAAATATAAAAVNKQSPKRFEVPPLLHPEVPVRTMTAVVPLSKMPSYGGRVSRRCDTLPLGALRKQRSEHLNQKVNERTKTDLAEIMKIAELAQANGGEQQKDAAVGAAKEREKEQDHQMQSTSQSTVRAAGGYEPPPLKMSPILRRKSTDEAQQLASLSSPPAPNQIVSILKKKEHAFGESNNSSASSNASPVTFSANVMDTPSSKAGQSKRQGILKKRSSLDESRYYSRSHSPDERSILIKSARRNSLEESGSALAQQLHHQQHGILKQSSYDSSKSDGCPSANECQPHSILKKKDSLSTPSDTGAHVSKHVSISQAVHLAAAELGHHYDVEEDNNNNNSNSNSLMQEEYEIRPILKQESTSSEEAARPPKPILKKKSFGDADEHENIRPILKTSRKSSREEFDLSGLCSSYEANDFVNDSAVRPILKSESPSKRLSLGAAELMPSSSATSLLKRRTRSLERHDVKGGVSPMQDLAAALNAISLTSPAVSGAPPSAEAVAPSFGSSSPVVPVDFVTSPTSVSVAERIKNMEMMNSTANGSYDLLPLDKDTPPTQPPKLYKPSVLRRDLNRERYKTQPVTSDEKSFFKANSTPFDISATSAFKPTKPLDIRASHLQQQNQQQQPLISPITGQPLSHVPAPLLLSSSTHSVAGSGIGIGAGFSAFKLPRSSTQPTQASLQSLQAARAAGLARQQAVNDSSSLSEQLTLSAGNDSEQIFEMSALDEDSAIQSLGDEASTASTTTTTTTASSSGVGSGAGGGVVRSNSVRARANMFQQLQEQTRSRREAAGDAQSLVNRQAGVRHSLPATAAASTPATSRTSPLGDAQQQQQSSNASGSAAQDNEDFGGKSATALKGILKSKPPGGLPMGRGLMLTDLNAELKNRLQRSTHATVSNLRKSATTADATRATAGADEVDNAQRNLAQILRQVPKENATPSHDDAVNLVRNLATLGQPRAAARQSADEAGGTYASASEGESSGGREIEAIIKNSAAARRRRQQQQQQQQAPLQPPSQQPDGNLIAKSKSHSGIAAAGPPGGLPIGPQLPALGSGGFIKLRHVADADDPHTIADKPNAEAQLHTSTKLEAQTKDEEQQQQQQEDVPSSSGLPDFLQGGLRRCMTQVMGPDQRTNAIAKTGSIAERLAALQRSGEDDWKKRISKRDEVDEIKRENFMNESLSLAHSLSDKPLPPSPLISASIEGGKVADRLGKLKTNSENWKQRIEQPDANKFTVAGRLKTKANSPAELQFERSTNDAAKKCPMLEVRSANQPQLGLAKSPSMMVSSSANAATSIGKSTLRSLSTNAEESQAGSSHSQSSSDSDGERADSTKQHKEKANNKSALAPTNVGARIVVPRLDDEETFESFFAKQASTESAQATEAELEISAFDDIKPTERLVSKRHVQGPKGRRAARNPLKNLAARSDISAEYTEIKTGIAEREMRRLKLESFGQRGNLAAEAIAGLASVEDFKSVALKSSALPMQQMWLPHKPLMLLHVKGRTHVQTRLVAPVRESLNRGDCFILVAGQQLYRYVGSLANVIEISRSKKICAAIVENKDLGCTATQEIILTDGRLVNERQWRQFWQLLGASESDATDEVDSLQAPAIADCGHSDEDDVFESSLIETNKVYEFQDDALLPLEKYWGCIPKVDMLDTRKVLVFDFGSELYVWNGKNASSDAKRAAIKLAQEHFSDPQAADYSQCYLNPLNYSSIVGRRASTHFAKRSAQRPDWCVLGKITQNMETVLFKEKFSDWPELEREDLEKDYLANGQAAAMRALDGSALHKGEPYEEPNLVLEHANLGRGNFYYDTDTMRHFDIITKSMDKWQIHEFNFDAMGDSRAQCGHFYSAESYIVRWIYQISVTVRELSGKVSNRATVGRDRCVYFTWQGQDSSANEKGAAALLTVELDKEKGAQMRVAQGDECTAFVRLFGQLYQHRGRREECLARRKEWRLYQLQGNLTEETQLKEVVCEAQQLRSRASMLLVHGQQGELLLWHGSQSAPHTRALALTAAELVLEQFPEDLFSCARDSVQLQQLEEGQESDTFKQALDLAKQDAEEKSLYHSLLGASKAYDYTLRLFHLSSTQGVFKASELSDPMRCRDLPSAYPFTQAQLYNARQPTIFLLDDGDVLWLWMGWWPLEEVTVTKGNAEERESPTNDNRAGVNRWISERRAALETAVEYWRAKHGDDDAEAPFHGIKGQVVWAGLEPLAFQALFPYWCQRDDVRDINLEDGRTEQPMAISEMLAQMTQTEYPLEVLKARPLPEGVEPTRLELYLNADDFQQALGCSRAEFEQLPIWKQTNLKKQRGLF